jgi:hypothetical protein
MRQPHDAVVTVGPDPGQAGVVGESFVERFDHCIRVVALRTPHRRLHQASIENVVLRRL